MASNRGGRGFDAKLGASLNKIVAGKRLGAAGSTPRLSSIRPARDLSLGGQSKRTFTPNIPVRRIKEEHENFQSQDSSEGNRDRGHDRRGRGGHRGRGRREIVTSASIFSHGPFAGANFQGMARANKFKREDGEGVSKRAMVRGSKGEHEVDDESQKILDMLQHEGKIDLEEMDAGKLIPVTIPLANTKLLAKKEEEDYDAASMDVDLDSGDERTVPSSTEDKSRKPEFKSKPLPRTAKLVSDLTCSELFTRSTHNEELLFFQFPDVLPIKSLSTERATLPSSSQEDINAKPNVSKKAEEENLEESFKKFSFHNVSEGYIGKLQIHKSGRVRLLLGNATLDVSMGIPCGFLQDLVSVHVEEDRREMLSLGHVSHRLVCTPNYEDLLGSLDTLEGIKEVSG